ncbi:50S ribosomal protein L29 [Mycoplasmopsis agassizii]|uniref:Large ribosomal subunit protein uL29 n=1 Tax=Mycoplasmopsis agassizii TaxID=33922 RepID=A0A269TJN6_9BACT|nr:50S ribosomal protein L29 [Mycoplasmopsis agassizii]PAK21664.1 50S ribosomal protein L29 [Mycoplasmopsis agassizii]
MKFKEMSKKSRAEIKQLLTDVRAELFTLRFQNRTGQLDKTHKIKELRREVAKLLTVLQITENEGEN